MMTKKLIFSFILLIFSRLILIAQADTDFVFIKGGKFLMGNNNGQQDEKPVHKVKINDFKVSKYEVTNSQFCLFLNEKGNQHEGNTLWIDLNGKWRNEKCRIYQKNGKYYVEKGYENYPVTFVSWYGANAYCKWRGGRLPTEAEWEYLAKTGFDKNMLDSIQLYAVSKENSGYKPNPVGTKKPDKNGLYDLFGNMSEWCSDWYIAEYYFFSGKKNPKGPEFGNMKCKRGGNWSATNNNFYPSNRKAANPNSNNITIGFRVVLDVK